MNEQLKLLIELQGIDTAILSLNETIQAYPKKLENYSGPVKEAEEAYNRFKAKSDSIGKKKKDREIELDEVQDKINKLRARSSDIKTNKEYEAHLREIEGFEKNKYRIEDEILSVMEDLESFSAELKKEEIKLKEAEGKFREQEKLLREEAEKLKIQINELKEKRQGIITQLDKDLYEQYMALLKRLDGLAVVQASNEICRGCNTNIPPQLFNEIKENKDIHTCYFCKRILYYNEAVPPAKGAGETA